MDRKLTLTIGCYCPVIAQYVYFMLKVLEGSILRIRLDEVIFFPESQLTASEVIEFCFGSTPELSKLYKDESIIKEYRVDTSGSQNIELYT